MSPRARATARTSSTEGRGGRGARAATRLRTVAPSGVLESRVPFAALCCGVIVVTLLGVLAINIQLSRGAYAAADLRSERRLLGEQEQELRERLAVAETPGAVQARASELGMVPSPDKAFISLSEGTVVAEGSPAPGPRVDQAQDEPQDDEPQDDEPQDPGSAP